MIHPKYHILEKILSDEIKHNSDSRILVFVKFRVSVKNIVNMLKKVKDIKPARFVGQATKSKDDKGLSQKRQIEILEQFKEGTYNVLVSTNVGEEGLDIAECDLVIFYDVVASEIRFIQRRGRTARHREGKVVILYCKNTNDEIYMRIVLSKLKKMDVNLKKSNELKNYYNSKNEQIEIKEQEQILPVKEKTFLEEKKPSEPLKKKRQSNLELFIKNKTDKIASKKKSNIIDMKSNVVLCKSFPMKFGLRKKLTNAGISFNIIDSNIHIIVHNKIILQNYNLNNYSEELKKEILYFNNQMKSQYQLIINIINFIEFEESFEGEMHLLKRELREFGTAYNIKIIPMDKAKDLFIIVRDLYQHSQKEKGV